MTLSRTETWLLRRYAQYTASPPTFLALLKASSRHLLMFAAFGVGGGYLLYAIDEVIAASFVTGMALGAITRQLGQLRVAVAAAPVLSRIIDPERIQRLLNPTRPAGHA